MPNIMICGFPEVQANKLKVKICQVMMDLNLGSDAVTSIVNMRVVSCDGKETPMPYIRICSTDGLEIRNITDALKKAKVLVDVEWLVLNSFIPAAEMG
ncbi:MAG: hypothetical protein AAB503_00885 [Patescibacteria group bacterium]